MKKIIVTSLLLATLLTGADAAVDPNFYIYLCFGQSNMEGNAAAESADKTDVDSRFRMLATTDFDSPRRTRGQWYTATPPIVSPQGGLGMADYFGRTMVAALPDSISVGVVDVAIGGCKIQMFDKTQYKTQLTNPNDYSAMLANKFYGGNPYQRLVDMARVAQQAGIIKGVLLHQGCSNNGDPNWPAMVKKIYNDLLADLGLSADSVPLFAGETLRQEYGGGCYAHNTVVAKLPSVVTTAHVVSSAGCEGNGTDPWHFCATGYRIMGRRYAEAALQLMGRDATAQPGYQMGATLSKFYTVSKLDLPTDYTAQPGQLQRIPVTAVYADGHREDVTLNMAYQSDDFEFTGTILHPADERQGTAEASYTDFLGHTTTASVHIDVRYFPFTADFVSQLAGKAQYDADSRTLHIGAGGQAGWQYKNGADMSAYKYLVLKLREPQTADAQLRIYHKNNVNGVCYRDTIGDRTTVVVDLSHMPYSASGAMVNPAKVYIVALRATKEGDVAIDDLFLTSDQQYATAVTTVGTPMATPDAVYSLDGRRLNPGKCLRPGLYVSGGKKLIRQR